ncbi:MAG: dihydroorotate dehydrogenase [Anaerostipes sp.]|nr:dihydroorotate dehydrogenase [Anaerostipes sp.]
MQLFFVDKEKNTSTLLVNTKEDQEIFRSIERCSMEHGLGLIYMIHHIEKNKIYYEVGSDNYYFVVEI